MGIITANSNDPLYRLNQIYDDIYSAKYPNEASVINDPLRGPLQDLYGCNLNMYDTHKIQFAKPQGMGIVNTGVAILEPETFYVYEGDGNKVLFPKGSIFDPEEMDITGIYSEGILIGLLDCKLRDNDYRKKNPYILYNQMKFLAHGYIKSTSDIYKYESHRNNKYGYGYAAYLRLLPDLFAVKKLIESGVSLEDIRETIYLGSDIEYCFKDKDNFLKIMASCNYTKIYRYAINLPQIVFDEEPVIVHNENINQEFEAKYKSLKKEEKEEIKKDLEESAKDIIENILDDKSSKEFHVYMYNCFEDESLDEIGLCIDAKSTKTQLDIQANYIYTTNTHYVSTDLIRKGYRIFIHMNKDKVYEMKIGENDWTDREIKWAHKLETFLYNGEMN